MDLDRIRYTHNHRIAFRKVEKDILGKNTVRSLFHDLDKVILYLFLPHDIVHNIHQKYSRHHAARARTRNDFIQMIIDWECARFTKPDKPLNAYQTLYKYYPELESKILPLLIEFHLVPQ